MKYTMKIFDNETGKLVHSIDFDSLIAGYSTEKDGEKCGGSIGITNDSTKGIGIAIDSVDEVQQAILKDRPELAIAYLLAKTAKKTSTMVKKECETDGES